VENLPAIRPLMRKVVTATLQEDGCLSYAYAEDITEPGLIRVSETWRDRASLARHFEAPHMAEWKRERAALGLFDREMRCWQVGEGEVL